MKLKSVYLGLLLALALILSYVETLIPFSVAVPGIKIGMSNLTVIWCLYLLSFREAMLLSVSKAILSGLLFGNQKKWSFLFTSSFGPLQFFSHCLCCCFFFYSFFLGNFLCYVSSIQVYVVHSTIKWVQQCRLVQEIGQARIDWILNVIFFNLNLFKFCPIQI